MQHIKTWVKKATFDTSDLQGSSNGGYLNTAQAQVFLRDAIENTEILSRADTFDSDSHTLEIPKLSFNDRILYGATEGARLADGSREEPDTTKVTLATQHFKGDVPVTDEALEDNVEREGFADTLTEMISAGVGRDLETLAIKSDTDDASADFKKFDGIVQQLVDANVLVVDATNVESVKELLKLMHGKLPAKYRNPSYVFYVTTAAGDAWADENSGRATNLGDDSLTNPMLRPYRGRQVVEVPLLEGTQNSVDYSTFAIYTDPLNLKLGFWRRVRMESFRDPRDGVTSYLPSVRYNAVWAKPESVVLAKNVPDFD